MNKNKTFKITQQKEFVIPQERAVNKYKTLLNIQRNNDKDIIQ